jgi:hypothetical protein
MIIYFGTLFESCNIANVKLIIKSQIIKNKTKMVTYIGIATCLVVFASYFMTVKREERN